MTCGGVQRIMYCNGIFAICRGAPRAFWRLMLSPQQGFADFWTPYTSEEYPPIRCHQGGLMSGVSCTGRYCDNLALLEPVPLRGIAQQVYCPYGGFITGLACQGHYCDNIAVECSPLVNRRRTRIDIYV